MQRLHLLSATVLVVIAAGCQPEVLIAKNETATSGSSSGGGGLAGTGGGGGAGGSTAGGTGELPSAGEGGVIVRPEPPRLLADSVADFGSQDEHGWSYGYDSGSLDTFTLMTRKSVITEYVPASNDAWECWANDTAHWTQIFRLGAHPNGVETSRPNNSILQRAVRRWTSTFAGDVTIEGEVAKIDVEAGSNGVDAIVYVDGEERYTTFIGGQDGGGRAYKFVATLQVGSTVDFVLDPHESADHHDLSRFTGIVVRVDTGPTP